MEITAETLLSQLRDELQFLRAADDVGVDRGFLIFDPVQYKYFRIGTEISQILANWRLGTAGKLIAAMEKRDVTFDFDQVGELLQFVMTNNLCVMAPGESAKLILQHGKKKHWAISLLHNYLFFKIPLFYPHKFLTTCFPLVQWLGSRVTHVAILAITLLGLYLTARQWDVFMNSFVNFTSWQGIVLLGLALIVLKTGHELGHAFVATSYGCKVPVMGVAFLLLFPMLYSDVSDTWAVRDRVKRLKVDGAGMLVEVSMGGVCLFLWATFPPGTLRDLCFFIATTGWVMSVLINLSPFMRFDGYHILADALGIHNLQARGFAIGKWQMRKILLGLNDPLPEVFSTKMHRTLVAYAWGTWIYRFFLFLGIAVLVYFMFFKLLGILLFVVEIIWFIIMPLFKESALWWQRRKDIVSNWRGQLSFAFGAVFILALIMPLSQSVQIPVIISAEKSTSIYAPIAAQVAQVFVREGQHVQKGDVLLSLKWDDYNFLLKKAELKHRLIARRIEQGVSDIEDRALRPVFMRQAKTVQRTIKGLQRQNQNLVLKAEFDGIVRDVTVGLRQGLWVDQRQTLMQIVGGSARKTINGLIAETDVERIKLGASGVFVFENPQTQSISVQLNQIGVGTAAGQELIYLASTNNGPIEMAMTSQGTGQSVQTHYRIVLSGMSMESTIWNHQARGTVVLDAERASIARRFFSHMVSVLLRETGF